MSSLGMTIAVPVVRTVWPAIISVQGLRPVGFAIAFGSPSSLCYFFLAFLYGYLLSLCLAKELWLLYSQLKKLGLVY